MPHDAGTGRTAGLAYIWQYPVDEMHRGAFLDLYGRNRGWASLFQRDPKYIETALLEDADDSCCFVTIDYRTTHGARDAFRVNHAAGFGLLDDRGGGYTVAETFLGDFNLRDV